jgi:hypothetical protein
LAEVCAYLHDAEAAAALYPQLVPIADQVATNAGVLGCYGSLHFPAGLPASCLRRWDEAERHFEGALATNERLEGEILTRLRGKAKMLVFERDFLRPLTKEAGWNLTGKR